MRVNVHEVTLKAATVTVKSLTISGEQVTLPVFRQLLLEPVIDEKTCQFRGVPWGRVHYFPGDCAGKEEHGHLHIVWQKGEELRRACVLPQWEKAQDWREPLGTLNGQVICAIQSVALIEAFLARLKTAKKDDRSFHVVTEHADCRFGVSFFDRGPAWPEWSDSLLHLEALHDPDAAERFKENAKPCMTQMSGDELKEFKERCGPGSGCCVCFNRETHSSALKRASGGRRNQRARVGETQHGKPMNRRLSGFMLGKPRRPPTPTAPRPRRHSGTGSRPSDTWSGWPALVGC
jgi:hypothetical protein